MLNGLLQDVKVTKSKIQTTKDTLSFIETDSIGAKEIAVGSLIVLSENVVSG